jgi:hypothetical protein
MNLAATNSRSSPMTSDNILSTKYTPTALDFNKLKLRNKHFNGSSIFYNKSKKKSTLLFLTTTTMKPLQHALLNNRMVDAKPLLHRPVKNVQLGNPTFMNNYPKYPSNMFTNNKTFIDIKNEFIMYLKNRLSQANASISTKSLVKKLNSSSKVFQASRTAVTSTTTTAIVDSSEYYDAEPISFHKFNTKTNGPDEIINIWKLAFFLLAFVIGLVALLTILTLTMKFIL